MVAAVNSGIDQIWGGEGGSCLDAERLLTPLGVER